MRKFVLPYLAIGAVILGLVGSFQAAGQTPEQRQLWEAQRLQSLNEDRAKAERLTKEREWRKADPMAWVKTLNPMTAGGWEVRAVANDGSWATYVTDHQMKRSGQLVTVWLRQEYAEPQTDGNSVFQSVVEKAQYDCAKQQARALLIIYYSDNNIQGSEHTEEADPKNAPWNAIVPGTRDESNFMWACGAAKTAAHH